MRKAILVLFVLSWTMFSAQEVSDYRVKALVSQVKKDSPIDASDSNAWDLLEQSYQVTLQQDQGELENTDFVKKLNAFLDNPKSKNKHLTILYLYYNEVFQKEILSPNPDYNFLMDLVVAMKKEYNLVYKKEPVMLTILHAEMLQSAGQIDESKDVVAKGFKAHPESIPLQVYTAINTNNDKMKAELVKNHPNHWMVIQFLKN